MGHQDYFLRGRLYLQVNASYRAQGLVALHVDHIGTFFFAVQATCSRVYRVFLVVVTYFLLILKFKLF